MSCTAFITKDKALLHSSSHHPVRLCRAVHYCQGQSVTSSFGMLLWVPLTGWGQAVFGKGQMWKRWSSGGVCAKWGERHSSSVFYLWGLDWQICIWFRGLWLQLILITCPPSLQEVSNSPFCGLITLHCGPIKQTLTQRHKPHTT